MSGTRLGMAPPSLRQSLERGLRVALAIIAATPLAVFLSLNVATLVQGTAGGPRLDDYRAGSLVWFGVSKAGEGLQLTLLIGVLIGAAALAHRTPMGPNHDRSSPVAIPPLLAVLAMLAAPAVMPLLVGGPTGPLDISSSPLSLALTLQVVPALHGALRTVAAGRKPALGHAHYLVLSALALPALGGLVVLRHVMAPRSAPSVVYVSILIIALMLFAVASLNRSFLRLLTDDRRVGLIVAIAGVGALPLLLPPLMVRDGSTVAARGISTSGWATVLLILLGLMLLEAWSRTRRADGDGRTSIGSLPIALLLAPLWARHEWPVVPSDDFHFGEVFAPFVLWSTHGGAPYVDLPLVRGVVPNMLTGALNRIVSDGSAATFAYGAPLAAVLAIALAHLLLRGVVGVPIATAMVALLGVANHYAEADLVVFAAMVWLLGLLRGLLRTPPGWGPLGIGAVATVTVTLAILAYPLMGLATGAIVLVAGVAAALGALLGGDATEARAARRFLSGLTVATVAVAVSPLGGALRGAMGYVVESAVANGVANGVALGLTFERITFPRIMQFAFVGAGLTSVGLLVRRVGDVRHPGWDRWLALATAATPIALVVGLFGRLAGRVDPVDWSYRPSAGSVVIVGIVLPAVLLLLDGTAHRRPAWLAVATAAIIASSIHPPGGVLRSSLGLIEAPQHWTSSSQAALVPRLGHGQGSPEHLESIGRLAGAVRVLGDPDVVNLTNRNALDGYFGWTSPIAPLAPYNIGSIVAETAAVDALLAQTPDVFLIGPGDWHEARSLALRTPLLARHLMLTTTPFTCHGWLWAEPVDGTRPGSAVPSPSRAASCGSTGEDPAIDLWSTAIGAPEELALAPASWGSWGPLRPSADSPTLGPWEASSSPDLVTAEVVVPETMRSAADILLLDASCPSMTNPSRPSHRAVLRGRAEAARLTWPATHGGSSASFVWGAGTFAVPLDTYPSWFLREPEVETLRLTVPAGSCPGGWLVTAEFARRPAG